MKMAAHITIDAATHLKVWLWRMSCIRIAWHRARELHEIPKLSTCVR